MKIRILAIILLSMVFMGVVSASGINGDYNGNPIVKLKSNGMVLPVEDTPAIIYGDRTMVPIYMLKQLGADVTWDGNTYSVDVRLPTNSELPKVTESDITYLKILSLLSNHYLRLSNLGELLYGFATTMSNTFEAISVNNNVKESIEDSGSRLTYLSERYNSLLSDNEKAIEIAANYKISINTTTYEILNDYRVGLEYFKNSFDSLLKFYLSKNNVDFYEHLNNSKSGTNSIDSAITKSTDKYHVYFELLQEY